MKNSGNERWLTVHTVSKAGVKYPCIINLEHVISVRENDYEGKREGRNARIKTTDHTYIETAETVKEIESELRFY